MNDDDARAVRCLLWIFPCSKSSPVVAHLQTCSEEKVLSVGAPFCLDHRVLLVDTRKSHIITLPINHSR